MAFVPRLPSWPILATRYEYDPTNEVWSEAETFEAQLYNPLRGQDDEAGGMTYLMYPKENDVLKDTIFYENGPKADAVKIEWPKDSGKFWGYMVRDVAPRWRGFPNEHLIATLVRLTPEMYAHVIDGAPLPAASFPEVPVQTYLKTATPGEWLWGNEISARIKVADPAQPGTMFGALYMYYSREDNVIRDASQLGFDVFYDVIGPDLDVVSFVFPSESTERHYYQVLQVFPVNLGWADEHLVAMLKQVVGEGFTEPEEPPPPPPPPEMPAAWTVELSGMINGSCGNCTDLNATFDIDNVILSGLIWESDVIPWSCVNDDLLMRLTFSNPNFLLEVIDRDGPIVLASYGFDASSWDGSSPMSMSTISSESSLCVWASSVTLTPVP